MININQWVKEKLVENNNDKEVVYSMFRDMEEENGSPMNYATFSAAIRRQHSNLREDFEYKHQVPVTPNFDDKNSYEDVFNAGNVLVVGDMHIPFTHEGYLDFCKEQYVKHNCKTVVFIGDVLDMHTLSYHEHDPNGFSPDEELEIAIKMLQPWYKAFPNAYICMGNHDLLISRKAKTHGLPQRLFKSLKEIIEAPDGWKFSYSWQIDGVKYMHGTGGGGATAHKIRAMKNRQSTVLGHFHSVLGVDYSASHHDIIFGMAVGCGIDINAYAMEYGRDFIDRPLLGCGIVFNDRHATVIPMNL